MSEPTEQPTIRLLILDQSGPFRVSLSHLLACESGVEISGACGTRAEAMKVLESSNVDLVLLDFDHGVDFIGAAREAGYTCRFLIVSSALDVRKSALALKLGASGIFLKTEARSLVVHAIRLVAQGDMWIDPGVVHSLATELERYTRPEAQELPERERRVLAGIVAGHSNREIGEEMGISEAWVKEVVQRLFIRAGVKSRNQLARLVLDANLGFDGNGEVVAQDGMCIDPKVVYSFESEALERYRRPGARELPECERRVLAGIVKGHSNRKIGEEMGISEAWVKKVVKRLFIRAGVNTRSQLAGLALSAKRGVDQHGAGERLEESAELIVSLSRSSQLGLSGPDQSKCGTRLLA